MIVFNQNYQSNIHSQNDEHHLNSLKAVEGGGLTQHLKYKKRLSFEYLKSLGYLLKVN